jgi:hypothetical protein
MFSSKNCFLPGTVRSCDKDCMAYVGDGKTFCRLLNVIEKLVPVPTRPVAPTPPQNPRL